MTFSKYDPNLPPDDLDKLLAKTLPRIIPEPFPAFQYPVETKPRNTRWDVSRTTLAVSVAALLGLGLAMAPTQQPAAAPASTPNTNHLANSVADGRDILEKMNLEK